MSDKRFDDEVFRIKDLIIKNVGGRLIEREEKENRIKSERIFPFFFFTVSKKFVIFFLSVYT